jgi:hypothetical protein
LRNAYIDVFPSKRISPSSTLSIEIRREKKPLVKQFQDDEHHSPTFHFCERGFEVEDQAIRMDSSPGEGSSWR